MFSATYDPADDKLRIYPTARLEDETYARVKAAGYAFAPKQECFYAVWGPAREDLALELAGEIDDEDTTLVDRAEARADRFEDYSDKRASESQQAHQAAERIMDGIPIGQPILVGHHSERRARKDAERIHNGIRKAVDLWKTSQYWQQRAKGALAHAKYKGRPDVRARRIKGLEADLRKQEKRKQETLDHIALWEKVGTSGDPDKAMNTAKYIANFDHIHLPEGHAWGWSIWDALDKGKCTPAEARDYSIAAHQAYLPHCQRWIDHLTLRLEYERAMLVGDGGTVADQTSPEVGGGCRCWASPSHGWSWIKKVNKVSVTVHRNFNPGQRPFTQTIPFTDLKGVMTKAQVEAARAEGRLREDADGLGFYLLDAPPPAPKPAPEPAPAPFDVVAAQATLKAGVQVVTVPELFPTPPDLADRVVSTARIQPGDKVVEPSAGTGRLVEAILRVPGFGEHLTSSILAIEVNEPLALALAAKRYPRITVTNADFLLCDPPETDGWKFDVVVMNPPFSDQCEHVLHAIRFVRPGGRLVAVMSAAITFRTDTVYQQFGQLLATMHPVVESLPDDTFQEEGTSVKTCLLTLTVPEAV